MIQEYPKEELQEIYEGLTEDLKGALFSEDAANKISEICAKNGIEKDVELVSKLVGFVFLGLLPPDEFEKTLKEELKLNNGVAKEATKEITASVFYRVKESLEALYKIKIARPEIPSIKAKTEQRPGKDTYREPIE